MTEELAPLSVDLYELMPAIYRIRDAERGYPLHAFLEVIGEQVDIVKRDIDQLWDDFFIETCRDWVIAYIGDLVGNVAIHEVDQRRRADVAKTIYYRRRKGALPMLEELARDVTGWSAHAVAFFELLAWTQHMSHLRLRPAPDLHRRVRNALDAVGTAHVRNLDAMDRVDGPFDVSSHTVDVRPIGQREGWHNIRNVGFFLWRLQNYPLTGVRAKQADAPNSHGFYFSPLGNPTPLFHHPLSEVDEFGLADETHVRGPIRPLAFHFNRGNYYGKGKSLAIYRRETDQDPVDVDDIVWQRLGTWESPPAGKVAVDVQLGRLAFAPTDPPPESVTVHFNYGFSGAIGGGPYPRESGVIELAGDDIWRKTVAKPSSANPDADFETITEALNAWAAAAEGNKRDAIITILDNATYAEALAIEPGDSSLVIQAEDGFRPHLKLAGRLQVTGDHESAELSLSGLLIEGQIELSGSMGALRLAHCTLVPGLSLDECGDPTDPGASSLIAAPTNDSLEVHIESCITGALQLPTEMPDLFVNDSIIHGGELPAIFHLTDAVVGPGPRTTLERVTIWGGVLVKELQLASEVIFVDPVIVEKTQEGCVRFSYVPDQASRTPRRYRCQPDLGLEGITCLKAQARLRAHLRPSFTSDRYGDPGFGQLHASTPEGIRAGAEDGSEMGAFEHLKQPQREANLRIRLEEYLPFGLQAGLIYVT